MATITWLHLSDIHIGSGPYNSDIVIKALLDYLKDKLPADFRQIDLVFFTGDVANHGKAREYAMATEFFDDLIGTIGVPKGRLFIVPGNHDVDWDFVGLSAHAYSEFFNAHNLSNTDLRARVAAVFADVDTRRVILRRLSAYRSFTASYLGEQVHLSEDYNDISTAITVNSASLAIYCLNSALMCEGEFDRGHLIVGEHQVRVAKSTGEGKHLRICLLHHPLDWLADHDRSECEALISNISDFVLHGHIHKQAFRQVKGPGSDTYFFASGAGFDKRELPNACNIVTLNLDTGQGQALGLRYSDESGGFWTVDLISDPALAQTNGIFHFEVPKKLMQREEKNHWPVNLLQTRLPTTFPL